MPVGGAQLPDGGALGQGPPPITPPRRLWPTPALLSMAHTAQYIGGGGGGDGARSTQVRRGGGQAGTRAYTGEPFGTVRAATA